MTHDSQLFTITFLYIEEGNKLVLMTTGDVPAKTIEEADYALSSKNPNEADLVEFIENSINIFKMSEPGSEESVTHTAEEFQELYDLPFNELEEKVDEVIEAPLVEKIKVITASNEFTSPTDYLFAVSESSFTQPIDYLDEEESDESFYAPIVLSENDNLEEDTLPLMEALPSIEGVLQRLIATFDKVGPVIYPTESKQLLANDQQYMPPSLMPRVLEMLVNPVVNTKYKLYLDPSNTPYISSAPVTQFNPDNPNSIAAAPGSVGTLVINPNKVKILVQQFV